MKITFEEVLSKSTWLQHELLSSLTTESFKKVGEDRFWNVKLVINDVEVEPIIFNELMGKIEDFIDGEAKKLVNEKYEKVIEQAQELEKLLTDLKENVNDKL